MFLEKRIVIAIISLIGITIGGFSIAQTQDYSALFKSHITAKKKGFNETLKNHEKMVEPGVLWQTDDPAYLLSDTAIPYDKAQEAELLGQMADNQTPYFKLALMYARAHEWERALKILNSQIKQFPQSYSAISLRGAVYNAMGNYSLALEDLETAFDYTWIWREKLGNYKTHDIQQAFILAHSALALFHLGILESSNDKDGADSSLKRAKAQLKLDESNIALKTLITKIESEIEAKKFGITKAQRTEIENEIRTNVNECANYQNLEFAQKKGFQKEIILPKLLEAYELCGEFKKANDLRSNNSFILSQTPFKESKWDVKCDQDPSHLVAAMKSDYWKSKIGVRLGKFYLGCRQFAKAETAAKSAIDAFFISVPVWKADAEVREAYLIRINAQALQGKLEDAVEGFATVLQRPSSNLKKDPKMDTKEYDEFLQKAVGALQSATKAGLYDKGFSKNAKIIIDASENRIAQKAEEKKIAEEKVKFCNNALKSASEIYSSTASSVGSKGIDGKIAAWDYACIRLNDIANESSNKCPWEVNQKLFQLRDSAKSTAYGLMKQEKDAYGGIYKLGC